MRTKWVFASLALMGLGAYLVGCPGSLDDEARFRTDGGTNQPLTCDDAMPIFAASCLDSGCHNKTDKYGNLDLETPGVVSRYKGVKTVGGGGAHLLVDPADPSKSAIYTKTLATKPFGLRMPVTGTPLSDEQSKCILDWIAKEAAGGGGDAGGDSATEETGGDAAGD